MRGLGSYHVTGVGQQRTNRQNVQSGIKFTIGHFKLEIGDWGLEIEDWRLGIGNRMELVAIGWIRLEKAGVDWNRLDQAGKGVFQPIPAYCRLFSSITAYSSLFQPIPVYSSIVQSIPTYSSLFQLIPAYSYLFQPMPSYSSLYPNPQSPISNPQSPILNAQLCILSPIGHFVCQFSNERPMKLLFDRCWPMSGLKIYCTARGHTYIHRTTHGHRDYQTDPAQRAVSVKNNKFTNLLQCKDQTIIISDRISRLPRNPLSVR